MPPSHSQATVPLDTSNINHLWASLLIEELVRCGVELFCLAPGSRSTPLTTAVARHPKAQPLVHYDERGAAFAALGYGRTTGNPAAWITTSGTAVANGLPAVVEAAVDNVPLLLLTADRPPELRETGANQTIDQVKIFGDYTRWFFDLPTPVTEISPQMVLTTADQGVHRARRAPAGPVHLNCMFRKPLHPEEDGRDYDGYLAPLEEWREQKTPYTRYAKASPTPAPEEIQALAAEVQSIERGLLVVGRLDTTVQAEAVAALARRLGWPVLPDVTSRLRLGGREAGAPFIDYYDQILASTAFQETHRVEAVLHLGGRVQSKRLRLYLKSARPPLYAVVRDDPARLDPEHQVSRRFEGGIAAFCEALAGAFDATEKAPSPWQKNWQAASRDVGAMFDAFAEEQDQLSEPLAARLLTQYLPEGHGLFLASSMPVRDVDRYGMAGSGMVSVAANRGASGIDGTIASAAGFATGLGRPVTLLIGDLALLHDLNALALLQDVPVTAVVLNNDGGGIFSFLPISQHEDVFEPYFATPHGRSFEAAAALFGLHYAQPDSTDAFVKAYRTAAASGRSALIEVKTDRTENRDVHAELDRRAVEAVADALRES